MLRHLITALAVVCTFMRAEAVVGGKARVAKYAPASFNQYVQNPNATQKQWIVDHYPRLAVFPPFFDTRLAWFPNAWSYKDLYAIYPGTALANAHPDWILKDAAGRNLYIKYACSGGACSQFAGDIGNTSFRANWISEASAILAKGYKGLLIDDVNMRIDRVSDGNGTPVAPRDPRTGATMPEADWRRYMAEFTEQIRAAFPQKELVHNALWFAGTSDPFVQRQLIAADAIAMERGVNDAGIVHGTGTFGFETFLGFIDWQHQHGHGVWLDATATTDADREYGLASHLLVTEGADYIGNTPGAEPDNWWSGYDVDLGTALGARTLLSGVFQRDFSGGRVLVNQPGSSQATVSLGGTYLTITGASVTSITLGAAQGAVLRRVGATTTSTTATTTTTSRPSSTTSVPTTTTTSRPSTTLVPTTTTTSRPSSTTAVPTTTTTSKPSSTTAVPTTTTTSRPSSTTVTSTTTTTSRPSSTTVTSTTTTTSRPSSTTVTSTTTTTSRPSTTAAILTTTTTSRPSSTTSAPTTTTSRPSSSTTTLPSGTCPGGSGFPDTDGDGVGDACDPCTPNIATSQDKAKLSLTKLLAPANDDRLRFKVTFNGVPLSPQIDPVANGIRFLLAAGAGSPRVDVTIAGGAYDSTSRAGWKANTTATSWIYRNSGRVTPLVNGIEKVELRMLNTPGSLQFSVKGRNGNYPIDVADLPLVATVVIDMPVARTGQCGEAEFFPTSPTKPGCLATRAGNTVRCR